MKKFHTVLILILVSSAVFASGQAETAAAGPLERGAQLFNDGKLAEAAESFKTAAASEDTATSAAAYFNHGITQAMLAEQVQSPSEKRDLLEEAYQSLKRSAELNTLPEDRKNDARRNMEVIRERLSELPEQSREDRQDEKQNSQNGQEGKDSRSAQDNGKNSPQQDGQSQDRNNGGSNSPEELLQQQRELSSRTANEEEHGEELAEQQKALQQASEEQDLNEAAVNQAKAAEALKKGDRQTASEYQKAAEKALSEAVNGGDNSELNDILDQEAENQMQRNRLDKTGGITDAERNW